MATLEATILKLYAYGDLRETARRVVSKAGHMPHVLSGINPKSKYVLILG